MQTLILESDNKKAIKAIKAIAKEMNIKTTEKEIEEETREFFYINGVRVRKAKGILNVEKMAGSLTHLNFEDPKKIRKNAWRRKKTEF